MTSTLERTFLFYWHLLAPNHPEPACEFHFDAKRKWRFDCAWEAYKLAVELEGGEWIQGRHQRAQGFINDCHKYNAATAQGWRILRFTTSMIEDNPQACIDLITGLMEEP